MAPLRPSEGSGVEPPLPRTLTAWEIADLSKDDAGPRLHSGAGRVDAIVDAGGEAALPNQNGGALPAINHFPAPRGRNAASGRSRTVGVGSGALYQGFWSCLLYTS